MNDVGSEKLVRAHIVASCSLKKKRKKKKNKKKRNYQLRQESRESRESFLPRVVIELTLDAHLAPGWMEERVTNRCKTGGCRSASTTDHVSPPLDRSSRPAPRRESFRDHQSPNPKIVDALTERAKMNSQFPKGATYLAARYITRSFLRSLLGLVPISRSRSRGSRSRVLSLSATSRRHRRDETGDPR